MEDFMKDFYGSQARIEGPLEKGSYDSDEYAQAQREDLQEQDAKDRRRGLGRYSEEEAGGTNPLKIGERVPQAQEPSAGPHADVGPQKYQKWLKENPGSTTFDAMRATRDPNRPVTSDRQLSGAMGRFNEAKESWQPKDVEKSLTPSILDLYADVDTTPVIQRAADMWRLRKAGEMVDPDLTRANVEAKARTEQDPRGSNYGSLDFGGDEEREKAFHQQIGQGQRQLDESKREIGEEREPSGALYTNPYDPEPESPYSA